MASPAQKLERGGEMPIVKWLNKPIEFIPLDEVPQAEKCIFPKWSWIISNMLPETAGKIIVENHKIAERARNSILGSLRSGRYRKDFIIRTRVIENTIYFWKEGG